MGKRDGGAAFPRDGGLHEDHAGMSLRDYFAAAALPLAAKRYESVSNNEVERMFGSRATNISRERIIAKLTYAVADAMIAARTQGSE